MCPAKNPVELKTYKEAEISVKMESSLTTTRAYV